MERSEYKTVVGPAALADADALFDEWCKARGWTRQALADDVLIDTGHGTDGDWRRYLVRRSRLMGDDA